jgi:RNA polymerase sigma factor (sigma-70 family)
MINAMSPDLERTHHETPAVVVTHTMPVDAETAYRLHRNELVRFGRAMLLNPTRAEDLVHDAFVRAYSRHKTLEEPAAYLRKVMINLITDAGRRDLLFRRRAAELHDPITPDIQGSSSDRVALLRSIQRLPIKQRAAVVLRFYEDRSEADIATILNCRPGTVKSLLSRALTSLRSEVLR